MTTIPDWGATPFAAGSDRVSIGKDIDRFNAAKKKETAKAGAHWIDVTEISREALRDRSLIATDGLHPSGKMYARWVEAALAAVRAALKI